MTKITYEDKVTLNENASVPAINKCQASDMNEIKSVVNAGITQTETNTNDIASLQQGWYKTGLNPTLTFVSFDSNTGIGIVSSNVDLTLYIGVGMKAKFTQSSAVKYAVITAISSTQLTFFLGASYSINNSAITNVYFSMMRTPYGLPQDMASDNYILMNAQSTGPWNLSLSAASFNSFDIIYMKSGSYNSLKVSNPNGKTLSLICANAYASASLQTIQASVSISGKVLTKVNEVYFLMGSSPTTSNVANSNDINITLITGHIFS